MSLPKTTTDWFVEQYAARGIHFQGIFAWEAASVDHNVFWQQVPGNLAHRVHLYNTPVQQNLMQGGQPLSILHQVYQPGSVWW